MSDPVTILQGDCRETLRTLPSESVHCCVTSPPYFGLRDYNCDGQIGLEPTPEAYVAQLVEVFREVKRVLRRDGTCWLNLGDSYAQTGGRSEQGSTSQRLGRRNVEAQEKRASTRPPVGLKPKDLIGIPWMVAFALQAEGWYLRSDIIWHKPNPMPESVTDRPTKSHEYVFLLAKAERYFYDADAIREAGVEPDRVRQDRIGGGNGHTVRHSLGGLMNGSPSRNRRSVWTINPQPFNGAHFATFPEELARTCILAGTSEQGCCAACGAPWRRVTEKGEPDADWMKSCGADANGSYHGSATKHYAGTGAQDPSAVKARILAGMRKRKTVSWEPTCSCPAAEPVPCTVLDPFAGSGTTLAVAVRHGRRAIGCELSPEYVEIIRRRVGREDGLFTPLGALEPVTPTSQPALFGGAE